LRAAPRSRAPRAPAVAYNGPASMASAGWERADGAPVAREVRGVTYPELGSSLQVRVLALTDDGLVMHLAGGDGVWQVRVTGHVER
jgi:hypothetical protein